MSKRWLTSGMAGSRRSESSGLFLSPSINSACFLSGLILRQIISSTPWSLAVLGLHHLYSSRLQVNAHLRHLFCTRTLALICHMAISKPITMSRRLGSYTHLESGDWLTASFGRGMVAKEPEGVYQKRGERGRQSQQVSIRDSHSICILYILYPIK